MSAHLIQATAARIPLGDETVQCCVTSPPYWGLRSYAGEQREVWPDEWYGALGQEPTPEAYCEHIVAIFREIKRVLRKDGTLWLNLGDSYNNFRVSTNGQSVHHGEQRDKPPGRRAVSHALKEKDLVGIPWRVAFALQADGWWLRSDIVWSKPNPMPESVTDRPTKAHEYVFLLAKSERYYYDADAIREAPQASTLARLAQNNGHPTMDGSRERRRNGHLGTATDTMRPDQMLHENGRNARTVWSIATQPWSGAHFATYPEKLAERCILAGSAQKACGVCGAPWERVVEQGELVPDDPSYKPRGNLAPDGFVKRALHPAGTEQGHPNHHYERSTTGWQPTCAHEDGSSSSLILDPFSGSGTSGRVAVRHGRRYVGLDVSREYLSEQATKRIDKVQTVMALND